MHTKFIKLLFLLLKSSLINLELLISLSITLANAVSLAYSKTPLHQAINDDMDIKY